VPEGGRAGKFVLAFHLELQSLLLLDEPTVPCHEVDDGVGIFQTGQGVLLLVASYLFLLFYHHLVLRHEISPFLKFGAALLSLAAFPF
jgi:hypothetical protein